MQVTRSIFKAYDIRGIVPATLNEELAQALGRSFGRRALDEGEKTVAVGRDGRLSGPTLVAALVRGLVSAGVDVIDIGMVTTPMLYFAASTLCTSEVEHRRGHHADVDHIDASRDQAAHQGGAKRRAAQAAIAPDGDGFLAFVEGAAAEGATQCLGQFFIEGGGDDAADVVGLEDGAGDLHGRLEATGRPEL